MESWLDYKKVFQNISISDMLDEIFSISRVQDEVIRLNQEQLTQGLDSDKKVIITDKAKIENAGHVYAINTIRGTSRYKGKIEKGQPYKEVTLKDTGQFYNSFRLLIREKYYEILADFRKGDENIMDNFRTSDFEFLGLSDDNLEQLIIHTILPQLGKMINDRVFL